MEQQTLEREALYGYVRPDGEKIPRNVERDPTDHEKPDDEEIRATTHRCRNRRAGGVSRMWAEDVKGWLRDMEREEAGEEGCESRGGTWRLVVKLIQHIWEILNTCSILRVSKEVTLYNIQYGAINNN